MRYAELCVASAGMRCDDDAVTRYMKKILIGERPSDAEWYEHLLMFNRVHPGGTPKIFRAFTNDDRRSSYELLAQAVAAFGPAANVIDIGCGDGALVPDLRRALPDALIVGVDISDVEIDAARLKVDDKRVRFIQSHAAKLPIASNSIDAVVSHLALMLMPDVDEVLVEIRRMLRRGGRLAFVVDHPEGRGEDLMAKFANVGASIREQYPGLALENPGDPRFCEAVGIETHLHALGFTDIVITSLVTTAELSAEAYWTFLETTYVIGMLEESVRARVRDKVLGSLTSESVTMQMPLLLVTVKNAV